MRICIITLRSGTVTGIETVNRALAKTLLEMGRAVELAVPAGPFGFAMLEKLSGDAGCPVWEISGTEGNPKVGFLEDAEVQKLARQLQPYDAIFISGAGFHYARIIRAALGRKVVVVTHGPHVSPLTHWDGAEMRRPGVTYACINQLHMLEAQRHGLGSQAVMLDLPIPFMPREVQLAGNYCVAVGTEPRKRLDRVAEAAAALQMECRVFGPVPETQIPGLTYMGQVPHEELQEVIAGAAFMLHMADMEGRPMCVLEAIGLGVPVIAPNTALYGFLSEAPWCVRLEPGRDVAEQMDSDFDRRFLAIENREALAGWAHGQYGMEAFKARLAELLGV